jgi:hypothetical protein
VCIGRLIQFKLGVPGTFVSRTALPSSCAPTSIASRSCLIVIATA